MIREPPVSLVDNVNILNFLSKRDDSGPADGTLRLNVINRQKGGPDIKSGLNAEMTVLDIPGFNTGGEPRFKTPRCEKVRLFTAVR